MSWATSTDHRVIVCIHHCSPAGKGGASTRRLRHDHCEQRCSLFALDWLGPSKISQISSDSVVAIGVFILSTKICSMHLFFRTVKFLSFGFLSAFPSIFLSGQDAWPFPRFIFPGIHSHIHLLIYSHQEKVPRMIYDQNDKSATKGIKMTAIMISKKSVSHSSKGIGDGMDGG